MNAKIRELIAQHEQDGDFTHVPPTPDMLESAQRLLGVIIPQQFVDFLIEYGVGGIGGIEILGIEHNDPMSFLETTIRYRTYGLPQNLLAVENCDEWLYCLDCDTGAMVSWSQPDEVWDEHPDFDSFLLQRLKDAIENL